MTESAFYLESRSARLYAFETRPNGFSRATGIVFCAPFGEEKKASLRAYVETARGLAAEGFPCLRLDYFGTGDSDGDLAEADVDLWIENAVDAAKTLRNRTACEKIAFLGLRFGALVATHVAARFETAALLLWQPVVDGESYFEGELKRKLVREMMTAGRGATKREDVFRRLEAGETFDLDGYEITPRFYRSLVAKKFPNAVPTPPERCLLLQISFSDRLTPEIHRAQEALAAWPVAADLEKIVAPPFWSRVEIQSRPDVRDAVVAWARRHLD